MDCLNNQFNKACILKHSRTLKIITLLTIIIKYYFQITIQIENS